MGQIEKRVEDGGGFDGGSNWERERERERERTMAMKESKEERGIWDERTQKGNKL